MQSKIKIYCKYIHVDCLFSTIILIINYGIESRHFLIPSLFSLKILLWSHLKYPLIGATPCAASSRSAIVGSFFSADIFTLTFESNTNKHFFEYQHCKEFNEWILQGKSKLWGTSYIWLQVAHWTNWVL